MGYRTIQKKVLRDFINKHHDTAYTVEELVEAMVGELPTEQMPGRSTVYRLLSGMVEEGSVIRFTETSSRRFVYRSAECGSCLNHLHLKCTKCGKLVHMDSGASKEILSLIMDESSFSIDENTVLPGRCTGCR